jgi:site-specific DNA-methyltransferase (adenine-specific)
MSDFTKSKISKSDNFETPEDFYERLNREFKFNDDPCPIHGMGGLEREWGTRTFVNPPYSNPLPWIKKAYLESFNGKMVVMLLRGDTSTKWFHEWVLGKAEIRFVKGRLKFNGKPAPFPSILAIYKPTKKYACLLLSHGNGYGG